MTAGERIRGQLLRRTPTWALLGGLAMVGLWNGLRWLAAHTAVACALALAVLTWWAVDRGWWPWLMLATGMVCLGLGGVMELQPRWWRKVATVWASQRRLRWYRSRWEMTMVGAGLTLADDLPTLMGHRFGGADGEQDLDVLQVRTIPGQTITDWRHVAPRLAAAWGRTRVRVHGYGTYRTAAPAVLELYCSSRPPVDRTAVAGAQVPSTAVDEAVDGPVNPWGGTQVVPPAPPDQPRGAFPKQPRP